jgi:hypothetical protein
MRWNMRCIQLGWVTVGIVLFTLSPSFAHHGKDYLRVETPHIPRRGTYHFLSSQDWERKGNGDHFEIVPAVMYALSDQLAFEVHGHFSDEGEGLRLDALAPELRFQFPRDSHCNLLMGLTFEYEAGVVKEANDEWEARFLLHWDGPDSMVTFNFIASQEVGTDEPLHYGIGLGWRRQVPSQHAFAVELLWDFNGERHAELLPSWQVNAGTSLIKIGVGVGLTKDSPDVALRTGIVHSF